MANDNLPQNAAQMDAAKAAVLMQDITAEEREPNAAWDVVNMGFAPATDNPANDN